MTPYDIFRELTEHRELHTKMTRVGGDPVIYFQILSHDGECGLSKAVSESELLHTQVSVRDMTEKWADELMEAWTEEA